MQIVIDIPEEFYKNTKKYNRLYWEWFSSKSLTRAIKKGVVLPNNHGRLIDADFLIKQYHEYCYGNCIYENERNVMCRACETGYAIEMLENAPTVLPATEVSE